MSINLTESRQPLNLDYPNFMSRRLKQQSSRISNSGISKNFANWSSFTILLLTLLLASLIPVESTQISRLPNYDTMAQFREMELAQEELMFRSYDSDYVRDADAWCRRYLPHLPKLARLTCSAFPRATVLMAYAGTRIGLETCTDLFKNEMWRCEGLDKRTPMKGLLYLFRSPIMQTNTKERAIVEAFVGAAAALSVATACGDGYLSTECSCGVAPPESSSMGGMGGGGVSVANEGCHDNFKVGYELALNFLSTLFKALSKRDDPNYALSRHNMVGGVVTAMLTHKKKCACHGQSGACSVQTCWVEAEDMKTIGQRIRKKYLSPMEVEVNEKRQLISMEKNKRNRVNLPDWTDDKTNEWRTVYNQASEMWCYPNKINSGMGGRFCPEDIDDLGCSLFCCSANMTIPSTDNKRGASYAWQTFKYEHECKCQFQFCCSVECETCTFTERHRVCLGGGSPPSA